MCHLIFICKYRKKLLIRYDKEIKQIFYDVAEENDFNIVEKEMCNYERQYYNRKAKKSY